MLVDRLRAVQEAEGVSDEAFAERLGVDRSTWSRIKGGQSELTWRFVKAAVRCYPGLADVVRQEALAEPSGGRR